jgi:hypothetical protein
VTVNTPRPWASASARASRAPAGAICHISVRAVRQLAAYPQPRSASKTGTNRHSHARQCQMPIGGQTEQSTASGAAVSRRWRKTFPACMTAERFALKCKRARGLLPERALSDRQPGCSPRRTRWTSAIRKGPSGFGPFPS